MTDRTTRASDADWSAVVSLVAADGWALCPPEADCPVCLTFSPPEDGESREDWLARIGRAYRLARGKHARAGQAS